MAKFDAGQDKRLKKAEKDMTKARARVLALRRKQTPEVVPDYVFKDQAGKTVSLAQLFGAKKELILVHNMGAHCPYCTLWADGFTGLAKHLEDRAAFVVESADTPKQQKTFYRSRGWNFPMVSSAGSDFKRRMGFADEQGNPHPGVSVLVKSGGKIYRTARDTFGPGDDYCALWHLFDLLPKGAAGWTPKYRY